MDTFSITKVIIFSFSISFRRGRRFQIGDVPTESRVVSAHRGAKPMAAASRVQWNLHKKSTELFDNNEQMLFYRKVSLSILTC